MAERHSLQPAEHGGPPLARIDTTGVGLENQVPPPGQNLDFQRPPSEQPTQVMDVPAHNETPTLEKFRFDSARIDERDVRNQAYEAADQALRQEQEELLNRTGRRSRLMGSIRNIWRQTITRPGRRQNLMRNAEQQMIESQNIHLAEGGDAAAQQNDMNAIIGRVAENYLRTDEDEAIAASTNPLVEERVRNYIRLHHNGAPAADMQGAEQAIRDALQETNADTISGFSIEQLQELAQNISERANTEDALNKMMDQIEFYEARVRSGVRSEAHRSFAERALERMEQHGRIVVGAKTAVLAVTAAAIMFKATTSVLGKTIAPGIVGAGIAGLNEAGALQSERTHLERSSAKGQPVAGADQERRQELSESIANKVEAGTYIGRVERLTENANPEDLSPAELLQLIDIVAEIRFREREGIDRGLNLISFSSAANLETERFRLDQMQARAERYIMEGMGTADINQLITDRMNSEGFGADVTGNLESRDQAFRELRFRRVRRAMIRGAITGAIVGTLLQEGTAFVRPDYQGVLDATGGPPIAGHQTWLRNLLDGGGVWNGPDIPTEGTSGGGGEGLEPKFGPGPDGEQQIQVTSATQPDEISVPDRHDPDWNRHEYEGGLHGELIHDGWKTRISDGFRLVHEVHGEGSNGGYIALQDVYGNVIPGADKLVQGPPEGLTTGSLNTLHDLGIETEFHPGANGEKGVLDIIIPPKPEVPVAGPGVDANPGIDDVLSVPIVAPGPTRRKELEPDSHEFGLPAREPSSPSKPEKPGFPPPGQHQLNAAPVYPELTKEAETGARQQYDVDGDAEEITDQATITPQGAGSQTTAESRPSSDGGGDEAEPRRVFNMPPASEGTPKPTAAEGEAQPETGSEPEPGPSEPAAAANQPEQASEEQKEYTRLDRQIREAGARGLNDLRGIAERLSQENGLFTYEWSDTEPSIIGRKPEFTRSREYNQLARMLQRTLRVLENSKYGNKSTAFGERIANAENRDSLEQVLAEAKSEKILDAENNVTNNKLTRGQKSRLGRQIVEAFARTEPS